MNTSIPQVQAPVIVVPPESGDQPVDAMFNDSVQPQERQTDQPADSPPQLLDVQPISQSFTQSAPTPPVVNVTPAPPVAEAVSLLKQGIIKPVTPTPEAPLPTPPFTAPNPATGLQSVAPNTTAQEDLVVTRQSQISLIWEISQAVIALTITFAVIYSSVLKTVSQELANAFFLIVGFYFSRTNHEKIGGGGDKKNDTQSYEGR